VKHYGLKFINSLILFGIEKNWLISGTSLVFLSIISLYMHDVTGNAIVQHTIYSDLKKACDTVKGEYCAIFS
jgi:hypothetical protein